MPCISLGLVIYFHGLMCKVFVAAKVDEQRTMVGLLDNSFDID